MTSGGGGRRPVSHLLPLLLLLPMFLLLHLPIAIVGESSSSLGMQSCPAECASEKCRPVPADCTEAVVDRCACCLVCQRAAGETCGFDEDQEVDRGTCAAPLVCVKGICEEMLPLHCETVVCPSHNSSSRESGVEEAECPDDSRLVISPPPPGECCPPPGVCLCDPHKCHVPECSSTEHRVLIQKGNSSEPGRCCDTFECREIDDRCTAVQCPEVEERDVKTCPVDSIRAASHVPEGECCPVKSECQCRPLSVCRTAWCPMGTRIVVERKGDPTQPGACCDLWRCEEDGTDNQEFMCKHDGQSYAGGSEWAPSACEICKCKRGVAVCSKKLCPKLKGDCTWTSIPEGECCPVCEGCVTDENEKKVVNETWNKDDCTTCTCGLDGVAHCQRALCQVTCEHPRPVKGQCCPVCDEPTVVTQSPDCPSLEHCKLRCPHGLEKDENGCFTCECGIQKTESSANCSTTVAEGCDKKCPYGHAVDEETGCAKCACKVPADEQGRGDKCLDGKRESGELWTENGCRHCYCDNGEVFCSLVACAPRPESCAPEKWTKPEGECCASCHDHLHHHHRHPNATKGEELAVSSVFSSLSQLCDGVHLEGERWKIEDSSSIIVESSSSSSPSSSSCVTCACRAGRVLCSAAEKCPPVACENPVQKADSCCATCANDDGDDDKVEEDSREASKEEEKEENVKCLDARMTEYKAGDSWRADDCTSCRCSENATIDCFVETCEDSLAENCLKSGARLLTVAGRCCPLCSRSISPLRHQPPATGCKSAAGHLMSVGERWQEGLCTSCFCRSPGETRCTELICPPEMCRASSTDSDGSCCVPCAPAMIQGSHVSAPPAALVLLTFGLSGILLAILIAVILCRRRQDHRNRRRGHPFVLDEEEEKKSPSSSPPPPAVVLTSSSPSSSIRRLSTATMTALPATEEPLLMEENRRKEARSPSSSSTVSSGSPTTISSDGGRTAVLRTTTACKPQTM